ncbi:putative ribonuclease H protein [Vitis vinifera]|uniref:Putative ribonuclease H protein n=1 Tax=Vitis vinifera TaxID=29760 RepID=A0A438EMZ9_VITVI|nr:putative ribonuclease H protein [Vitis vinifera]
MEMMGFGAKWISWIQWCIGTVSFSVLINESKGGGVFVGGGISVVSYLSWLLMWFEAMSGLKVNLDKSEIIAVGRVENVEEVALEFGCKVSRLPSTYLGLPLGARFKEVATWDGVEERLRKRLSIWKRQYISKGGRMTLIRSTLSSMPIYCMSLFQMPRSVSLRLERIQRDFLWGGGALERKPHLVEWSIICSDKRKGGLGVRSLALLNKALLCKWSWRFCGGKGSFMEASHKCKERVGSGSNNLAYAVGNGRRIRFWEDKWCGDDKLCSLFPSLYAISLDKEAWVADVWSHSGGGVWAPRFSRSINDWEVIEVERLLLRLQGRRVYSDVEDEVIWTKAKDKRFSVKSLYKDLDPERRENFLQISFGILWCRRGFMGAPLFNKRSVIGVARALCGKGKEESVACSTLVPLLDCLEGKKQGLFVSGPTSVVDFVDWIGHGDIFDQPEQSCPMLSMLLQQSRRLLSGCRLLPP